MKYSAVEFSLAGDKYLGRSYEEMDCQAFVERCMRDVGLKMDLGGSNSWYREVMKNGWVGTPEECVKVFGSVPKGALLFIREPVSGSTPGKFRDDGIGDLTHIGIKTGRGKGAIHSCRSRGCVCESEFRDRTIKNGGWNRVGLYNRFDYGTTVSCHLEHNDNSQLPDRRYQSSNGNYDGCNVATVTQIKDLDSCSIIQNSELNKEGKKLTGTVYAESGSTVNLRKGPGKHFALVERIPVGSGVQILEESGEWEKVSAGGLTGWMMKEFLSTEESVASAEDSGASYSVVISGLDLTQARAVCNNYPHNSKMEKEVG